MQASKTFRIFVSSTFSDLKEERNALQQHVFPRLRELCTQHGCRFQAIDLRWGVRDEAALDQQTMKICLGEIERCQRVTPRPNFIVLLGDRYGWRPLPWEIPAIEFERIVQHVSQPEERNLLVWDEQQPSDQKGWYRRDDNAVPPVYCLQPREVKLSDDQSDEEEKAARQAEADLWREIERSLRRILLAAIDKASLRDEEKWKYLASATEQEIEAGAMRVDDAHEHVFCFFRQFKQLPQDENAKGFVDFEAERNPGEKGKLDEEARQQLAKLKANLSCRLPNNIPDPYEAEWTGKNIGQEKENIVVSTRCKDVLKAITQRLDELTKEKRAARLEADDWEHLEQIKAQSLQAPLTAQRSAAEEIVSPISLDHLPKLCADVYLALARIILEEIAGLEESDPLKKEIENHEAFGSERIRFKSNPKEEGESFFVGRSKYRNSIAEYLNRDDPHPLALFGEAGSGKTALMAQALEQAQKSHPNSVVIVRFIGATPNSSDGRTLLERLCRQIARRYGAGEASVPAEYQKLVEELPQRLALATADKPLIVFLDALDQLSDFEHARNLIWLPRDLPAHVRLIVSTLPGECLTQLERKLPEVNLVKLEPMPEKEGGELLGKWLAKAGRTLQDDQRAELLGKFAANGLPLYLKLAFEEARRWKSYSLPLQLGADIPGIVRELFRRLSADHGQMMVSHGLGYLEAAKNGLTEDELLDVLALDEEFFEDFKVHAHHDLPETDAKQRRLPVVVWSRLYFDLETYLTERSADGTYLLAFFHQQFGEIAAQEFLTGEDRLPFHRCLASYFDTQDLGARKVVELPWHLAQVREWEWLKSVLSNVPFLNAAWGFDGSAVMSYWTEVAAKLACRIDLAYAGRWEEAQKDGQDLSRLGTLLLTTGYPGEAEKVYAAQVKRCREVGDKPGLALALHCLSRILSNRGDGIGAKKLLDEATMICRDLKHVRELANVLESLAILKADYEGDHQGALTLFLEQEQWYRHHNDYIGLQGCLGNQANIYAYKFGDLKKGIELAIQGERLCEEHGIVIELPKHRMRRAVILKRMGQLKESLQLLEKAEEECRSLSLYDNLGACLGQHANILAEEGRYTEARWKNEAAEECYRRIQNWFGLTQCLFNQGVEALNVCENRQYIDQSECDFDWKSYGEAKAREALSYMKKVGYPAFPANTQSLCSELLIGLQHQPKFQVAPSIRSISSQWSDLKSISLTSLRRLEWKLLGPLAKTPQGLVRNRVLDKLTLGWVSRRMLRGMGKGAMYTAAEWFRLAASAILVRPTFQAAYLQRAINGTINSGDLASPEYRGYDETGRDVEYKNIHGIMDTEIILRMNPFHSAAQLLQGILISKTIMHGECKDKEQGLLLAKDLISHSLSGGNVPGGIKSEGERCLKQIKAILDEL